MFCVNDDRNLRCCPGHSSQRHHEGGMKFHLVVQDVSGCDAGSLD